MAIVALALLAAVGAAFIQAAEYVPGTPGAVWSDEEVRIVRLKILELLSLNETKTEEMFPKEEDLLWPHNGGQPISEMSLFRLSFHDCIAYQDGSPGCELEFQLSNLI